MLFNQLQPTLWHKFPIGQTLIVRDNNENHHMFLCLNKHQIANDNLEITWLNLQSGTVEYGCVDLQDNPDNRMRVINMKNGEIKTLDISLTMA